MITACKIKEASENNNNKRKCSECSGKTILFSTAVAPLLIFQIFECTESVQGQIAKDFNDRTTYSTARFSL